MTNSNAPSRRTEFAVRGKAPLSVQSWRVGALVLMAALVPVLAAIWGIRWFVTQDGSAHLYNAHIIASSLGPNSPFAAYYTVRWDALPNWSGHLVTAALVSVMPVWMAGPAITTLTLVGFAASIVWLRLRVDRTFRHLTRISARGSPVAQFFVAPGVHQLHAGRLPVSDHAWRLVGRARDIRVGSRRGHRGPDDRRLSLPPGEPWSDGIRADRPRGAQHLACAVGSGSSARWRRATAAGCRRILYRSLSKAGGPMQPVWGHLANPLSPAAWAVQLAQVDPITLTVGQVIPLTDHGSHSVVRPVQADDVADAWLHADVVLGHSPAPRPTVARPDERTGWAWLAALLLIGGIAGPDSLGASHGEFLQQRVMICWDSSRSFRSRTSTRAAGPARLIAGLARASTGRPVGDRAGTTR